MNRNKLILSVTGGVLGLAVIVTGFLAWSAYSSKVAALEGDEEEGVDGLETVVETASKLSRGAIYPCAQSVRAFESNATAVAAWKSEAYKLAARGDRAYKPTTPAQFKTDIVTEAKRLSSMAGAVNGAFVKPGFAFGPFKDFIAEGKMPADVDLARLQRQWDDVVTIVEILHSAGAVELVDVGYKTAVKEEPKEEEQTPRNKRKKKAKAKKTEAKAKGEGAGAGAKVNGTYSYTITFKAKPDAFMRAINAFATDERFIAVESFSFNRGPVDALATALGFNKKKQETNQQTSRRRGRRGAQAVEDPKPEEGVSKNGVITDPLLDDPLVVTMTIAVMDFGSLADDANEEKEAKK